MTDQHKLPLTTINYYEGVYNLLVVSKPSRTILKPHFRHLACLEVGWRRAKEEILRC